MKTGGTHNLPQLVKNGGKELMFTDVPTLTILIYLDSLGLKLFAATRAMFKLTSNYYCNKHKTIFSLKQSSEVFVLSSKCR